jgi:hypothetical protein
MNQITSVFKQFENVLDKGLSNIYVSTGLKVFLGLYAAMAAPKLPPFILKLFENPLMKVFWAGLIVIFATKKPDIALLLAIAFVITIEVANKQNIYDTSHSYTAPGEISWLPSTKPESYINFADTLRKLTKGKQEKEEFNTIAANIAKIAKIFGISQEEFQNLSLNDKKKLIEKYQEIKQEKKDNFEDKEDGDVKTVTVPFTTKAQFNDAQDNLVPQSDQTSCVQTFENQHCIQGLAQEGTVPGYDTNDKYSTL